MTERDTIPSSEHEVGALAKNPENVLCTPYEQAVRELGCHPYASRLTVWVSVRKLQPGLCKHNTFPETVFGCSDVWMRVQGCHCLRSSSLPTFLETGRDRVPWTGLRLGMKIWQEYLVQHVFFFLGTRKPGSRVLWSGRTRVLGGKGLV